MTGSNSQLMEAQESAQADVQAAQKDILERLKYERLLRQRLLLQRRRENGIAYYVPNAMQLKAHKSVASTILYCGANRSGKSHWGAAELAFHLTRNYPDWFPHDRRFHMPIRAVVVVTSFPVIERAIEPKIMELLPRSCIADPRRTPQGYLSQIKCVDGSSVDILTNEMDDMAFESASWDFYWGDEPQRKNKYMAIRRGLLDRRGLAVLTFTPLVEPWMKEELVDHEDGHRIEVFRVTLWDNRFDINGTEIQSEQAIREFEDDPAMTEEIRRTRVYGEFFHMRGLAWPQYCPQVHEKLWEYEYPDPVVCVLDPHTRNPHHAIWAFLNRCDQICVDRELVFDGTMKELAREILRTETAANYRVRRRLIDPNYGRMKMQVFSGRTIMEELASGPFPVSFGEACDEKNAGILKVAEFLNFNRSKELSITNCPKLFFHADRCKITIRSVRNYQFADWIGRAREDKDPKEDIKQKNTHGADCVRYLCMENLSYEGLKFDPARLEPELAYY